MSTVKIWLRFFLGSPQRFLWTMIGILAIACMVNPQLPATIVDRLLIAINPVIGPTLAILIVMAGIRIITGKK